MNERLRLLESIADTISDYREGELTPPSPEHVDQWVSQFDAPVQMPILCEMDHVLKKTYFSRTRTIKFLRRLLRSSKLAGNDPCTFWNGVKFLDIQGGGASQTEMLALFDRILKKECGFTVSDCGTKPRAFVYLDDAIFSGGRVRDDLTAWISDKAPNQGTLHTIVIATHQGSYFNRNRIAEALEKSGKKIKVNWWYAIQLEDRRRYMDKSDVLRPVSIPVDQSVQNYVNSLNYSQQLRKAGNIGNLEIFSSDSGRQVLEQEFLKAGARIREKSPNLNQYQRPLGNMVLQTFGFGSLVVTFRNCPNNAPLVLWAGHPWYPLFPRTTNKQTSTNRFLEMLAKERF